MLFDELGDLKRVLDVSGFEDDLVVVVTEYSLHHQNTRWVDTVRVHRERTSVGDC